MKAPKSPSMKRSDRKATTVVTVEASTGASIRRAARSAALAGGSPRWRRRASAFSAMTMASSTIMPRQMSSAKSEIKTLTKKLGEPAQRIATELRRRFNTDVDIAGSIGRRYRRQDEAGTPYCVTFDPQSEQDQKVTVRDRDTTHQDRISIDQLDAYLLERIPGS